MDTKARLEALEDKIQQQDKKLRLHKRLGLIAAALLIGATAFAATRPVADSIEVKKIRAEAIVAKNFYLRDDAGKARGVFSVTPEGVHLIMMGGKERKRKLLFSINKSGSSLRITDRQGVSRLIVALSNDEKSGDEFPLIQIRDRKRKIRLGLGVGDKDNSAARISFWDSAERPRVMIGAGEERPIFSFLDKAGKTRVEMKYSKDGYHELKFLNEKGDAYWPGSSISK